MTVPRNWKRCEKGMPMADEPVGDERLRKEVDYYRRQLDEMAGENVKLDLAVSGLRQEIRQKRQGFALLTELQQSIGAHGDVSAIFEVTIAAINASLGMDKTVVLEPMGAAHHYRPSQCLGFHRTLAESLASLDLEFPSEFADGTGLLLVNRSTEPTPLIEDIRTAFDLPYFICLPVMLGGRPLGLLLAGRAVENRPIHPPLDQGDVDTFQAIASLISSLLQNRQMAALQEANRQIQEQTERKSAFFASMSHELRTPMTSIKGYVDNMLDGIGGEVNERQLKSLVRVRQNSDHLLGLVNDLLDLSKIEAGRMDVEIQAFGVRALISACCETVAPLLKEGTRLRQDVSSEVGEALSDETKIRQIVINLLSNALKHTDEGEVWVRVSRDGSGDLEIAVSGTGTGIPVDQLEAIFQEFTQVKGSDPQHKGTGLGLPITKGYAELLGGSIVVESKVGEGSTFTVRIPMEFTEG